MLKRNKIFIGIIFILILSGIGVFLNSRDYVQNSSKINTNLYMGYFEKKDLADSYMADIEDYVSETRDKDYPDYVMDKLYENASEAYISLDVDKLKELEQQVEDRRNNLIQMNEFMELTKSNILKFDNNPRLNTTKYKNTITDIDTLLLDEKYDEAYNITMGIETDMEMIAIREIFNSEFIINELMIKNFTTVYLEDLLIQAKDSFSAAKTEELIKKVNLLNDGLFKDYSVGLINNIRNKKTKSEAVDFSLILKNTDEINYRKGQLLEIKDKIDLLNYKIDNYTYQNIETSEVADLLNQALVAYQDENFDKAITLLIEGNAVLESNKIKITLGDIVARESLSFVKRNWKNIIITIFGTSVAVYFFYRKHRLSKLKNKIRDLEIEMDVLNDLMKETQTERFVDKKISESLYDIKMEKYRERLNLAKSEIKTTRDVLKKLLKKKKPHKKKIKNSKNKKLYHKHKKNKTRTIKKRKIKHKPKRGKR